MKITIDIEAKEIAELRALLLPDERLFDSKIADVKKLAVDEIANTIATVINRTASWPEHGT